LRSAWVSASTMPWVRAAVRSWVEPGTRGRGPQQAAERVGEDLDVHAVALVFARVVRGVGGDPVDRQQGAVQDHERLGPCEAHRLGQGGREGGQYVHGLAYVAVCGRDADTRRRVGCRCHHSADGPGRAEPDGRRSDAATGSRSPLAGQRVARSDTAGCDWTGRSTTGRQAHEAPGGCGRSWSRTRLPGASAFRSSVQHL
jgi:hypothetical protein